MNMFLHGIEEFRIARGNTLSEPAFIENDELKTFNVILANPPYSIKAWDRTAFESDPWGRNLWGTPPQGCADYAFQQHIQKSLDEKNGRSIVLWPYGVLFRDSEAEMRKAMIEDDRVDCVIALGKNLFYNSIMESCLLICRNKKEKKRLNKVLFIDARKEIRNEKTISYLDDVHIDKISSVYNDYKEVKGFSAVVPTENIIAKGGSLNIPLYVKPINSEDCVGVDDAYKNWEESSRLLANSMNKLFSTIDG
jgi:type I restriction enzyme M protein